MYQAIIFDLDGVIINSEPLHEKATQVVFRRYGITVPDYIYTVYKGKTDRDLMGHVALEYANGAADVDTLIAEAQAAYQSLLPDLELIPSVYSLIEQAQQHFRLALTTSSVTRNQQAAFDKFNLDTFFEVVVTAADITRAKPDPEPYLKTVERLAVPASSCLVIEDSVNGVISGVAAGCTVAGITTSFDAEALTRAGAHFVISNYQALAEHLGLSLS